MQNPNIQFVISAPRSGSTWLCHALNRHPQIYATEQRLFGRFCEMWKNNDGSLSPRITFDAYAEGFAGHYFHDELNLDRSRFINQFQRGFINFLVQFALRRSGKTTLVDKITPYPDTSQLVCDRIASLLPESKIVFLLRDGRDVVTSGAFDWIQRDLEDHPRYDYFVRRRRGARLERFFDDDLLKRWCEMWCDSLSVARHDAVGLRLRYEDMKEDHAGSLVQLFTHLGVDPDFAIAKSCADATTFQKMTGRDSGEHRPTDKARRGVAGDWKNWFTRRDGELFQRWAGDRLMEWGYESDPSWIQRLPESLELVLASPFHRKA